MPALSFNLDLVGLYSSDMPTFEIWVDDVQLGGDYSISSSGTSITSSLSSIPSSVELRFNDASGEADRIIEIRSIRIAGQHINVGNSLSSNILENGQSATIDVASFMEAYNFSTDESGPESSTYTTDQTQSTSTENEMLRLFDSADDQVFDLDSGRDVAYLGSGADTINGGDGQDIIRGGDGNDLISGGADNDRLFGEEGDDTIYGGDGDDRLFGNEGNDKLSGGAGNDNLVGHDGDDILVGNDGDDKLNGGAGNDIAYGGAGNDTIVGGAGINTMDGGDGDDLIYGGADVDYIDGGADNDFIFSQGGNDIVYGSAGNDEIYGGDGDDVIYALDATVNILGDSENTIPSVGGSTPTTFLDNSFDADQEDFTYTDSGFGYSDSGTNSDETWDTANGNNANGSLRILNNQTHTGTGGSWGSSITVTDDTTNVQISFAYRHTHQFRNDAGEDSEVWFEFNGTTYDAVGGNSYISQYLGNSTTTYDSGWVEVTINLPDLSAGSYDFSFGTIQTGANAFGEVSGFWLDDVVIAGDVSSGGGGTTYGSASSATADADVAATDEVYGGAGNDTLYGHSGTVLLSGGDGNDKIYSGTVSSETTVNTLSGGDGQDTLYGSSGKDVFLFEAASAFNDVDAIENFGYSYDQLDLSDVLSLYTDGVDDIADFVQLTEAGGNTTVSVDVDGTANGVSFVDIAVINGVTGLDITQMESDGVLVV